ncbi:hypothetical protein SDC9_101670 [bioreactor metagenome]
MHRSGALLISLIGVAIGGLTFVFAVISLKVFTIREWLLLPFGKKILRFNQKFKKK